MNIKIEIEITEYFFLEKTIEKKGSIFQVDYPSYRCIASELGELRVSVVVLGA